MTIAKFLTKPRVVEAEQFFPDRRPWPPHVHLLTELVELAQLDIPNAVELSGVTYTVRTLSGWVKVEPGDWIVIDLAGAP